MTGSNEFHIEPTDSFVESLVLLEKETYGRNDKKGPKVIRELVEKMLEDLLDWPRLAGLRPEPFPPNTAADVPGWTFHKLEFSCPRANGAQRQGRLLILVNLTERLIRPAYIYTHAQFPGRVPNGPLKDLVIKAARASQPVMAVPEAPRHLMSNSKKR